MTAFIIYPCRVPWGRPRGRTCEAGNNVAAGVMHPFEVENIRRMMAASRRPTFSRRSGMAAAVLKTTSCAVIRTAVDDGTSTEGAAEGG